MAGLVAEFCCLIMMMLAACDDDGAGNGGILRFCLLATDMAGRARQQHEGVCGACGRGLATAQNLDKCVHIFMRVSRLAISVEYEK